ncbi:putative membrane protein [Paracoccus isoporae]|uniref:Protoporphyrinogen IX oxidase n=1 Tax=Paracoccus isoporae TaxID=591205 RepID=A0A1G6UYJ0_9RHOB|nr:CopD family protein [Paracoccus isoporae]SDD46368.1 putative membrane protein [Paracoccus isoporae]
MADLLASLYLPIKALHVMAVLSWMAGLFYLPRLYVYHAERGESGDGGAEPASSFAIMEEKLLRLIMTPAMILSWICGLLLVMTPGIVDWSMIWPWSKAASVLAMSWFHMWLAAQRRALAEGRGLSGRSYRMMNEVPTLLMAVIVLSVILKF